MLAAGFASLSKVEEDTRGTIDAMAGCEGGSNQSEESGILQGSV
jgi:hypothetical protein